MCARVTDLVASDLSVVDGRIRVDVFGERENTCDLMSILL